MNTIYEYKHVNTFLHKSKYLLFSFIHIILIIFASYKIYNNSGIITPNLELALLFIFIYIIYCIVYDLEYDSCVFDYILMVENGEIQLKGFKHFQPFNMKFNINEIGYTILKVYSARNSEKFIVFELQNKKTIYINKNVEDIYNLLKDNFPEKELKSKMALHLL